MSFVATDDPRQQLHLLAEEHDAVALCGFRPDAHWFAVRETLDLPVHVRICATCMDPAAQRPLFDVVRQVPEGGPSFTEPDPPEFDAPVL